MSPEQIQAALARGANVWDEYENKIIQVFQYEGDWMHVYITPQGYKCYPLDVAAGWSIEECDQSDSHPPLGITYSDISNIDFKEMAMMYRKITNGNPPQTDPFEANQFAVKCSDSLELEIVHKGIKKVGIPEFHQLDKGFPFIGVSDSQVNQWVEDEYLPKIVYDFWDRAKWLAHAKAIKDRQSWRWEVVSNDTEFRVIENSAIHKGNGKFYFSTESQAQVLADKLNAVLDGAKVVKNAIDLKAAAVCNHKAKDIHNIEWEATFNNL